MLAGIVHEATHIRDFRDGKANNFQKSKDDPECRSLEYAGTLQVYIDEREKFMSNNVDFSCSFDAE